jgi:D-glycerate 3-kinase
MSAVELIVSHILKHLSSVSGRPLFVAIQGPQGSGKSYTTAKVQAALSGPSTNLNVATLSLDDLYLPHQLLVELSEKHPDNPLLKGRGQPGTHDIALGLDILQSLKDGKIPVELPRFDKSLFNGEGDRLEMDGSGPIVATPPQVVILEGWCTGFATILEDELDRRWSGAWQEEVNALGIRDIGPVTKECIQQINSSIVQYSELWSFLDVFIQVKKCL